MLSESRRIVIDLTGRLRDWLDAGEVDAFGAVLPVPWQLVVPGAPAPGGAPLPGDAPGLLEAIREAEVYFGFGIAREVFLAGPRLRWVHSATAGVRSLLFPEMVARDVLLTNAAGVQSIPIAESVLAGVLALLRGVDLAAALKRERRWDATPFHRAPASLREVGDCRVLIVGTGGIGTAVAERFSALGARCTGLRRRPERGAPPGFLGVRGPEALAAALPDADVVVLAAPRGDATRRLLDRERLALLPRGAIVVNVARGDLVDEEALAEALDSGALRGAVLDVAQTEPLPPHSRLWDCPTAIITPHVAAVSPRRQSRRHLDLFRTNLEAYAAGRPLRNVVDKRAGY